MVTGRRILLLADDSPATQKVISLTFADEGIDVVAVGDGNEAVKRLEEGLMPDVILADVVMPGLTGYEICEHIKGDSRLRHIPVMLLVGMFEPYDLAEARRVGAETILTKPFQSIRDLMSKVKALFGGSQSSDSEPLAQLSAQTQEFADVGMDDEMIEERSVHENEPYAEASEAFADTIREPYVDDMPSFSSSPEPLAAQPAYASHVAVAASSDDALLDIDIEPPAAASEADDFILDLTESEARASRPSTPVISWKDRQKSFSNKSKKPSRVFVEPAVAVKKAAPAAVAAAAGSSASSEAKGVGVARTGVEEKLDLSKLSPEMVDQIARRVVELMSDTVVREIAWEVVPDLAELLIKEKLQQDAKK